MDFFFVEYWPWWLSACAFATITLGIWAIERRLLGVSSSYSLAVKGQTEAEKKLEQLDSSSLEDAMLKATLEEFGPEAIEAFEEAMAEEPSDAGQVAQPRSPRPRSVHVVFLLTLVAGGVIGAFLRGDLELSSQIGPVHEALTGGGAISWVVAALGGVMVGFGTRMAGGCTSGHGLSGCSRLQPGSLVATASFFAAAVGVSFLLEALR